MAIALSIRQPWAELILQGKKTIETRKWNSAFRGEFYIHASKTIDIEACKEFEIDPKSLVIGAIVGKAIFEDTKEYHTEEQFLKDDEKHKSGFYGFTKPKFGFLLRNAKRITPIHAKGNLNFFYVEL